MISRSLAFIIKSHEILRTCIREDKHGVGKQYPVILAKERGYEETVLVESIDELDELLKAESNHIFDLQNEIPVRIKYITVKNQGERKSWYLSIVIHHIAFDGWSADIFLGQLKSYYEYFSTNNDDPILDLDVLQYKDYSIWQRELVDSKSYEDQTSYWVSRLTGYINTELLPDYQRPEKFDYRGDDKYFELDVKCSNGLRGLARQLNVSLYSLLLSAFYFTVKKYVAKDDLVIGVPALNRHYQQLENLIGFFVNTLAVRIHLPTEDDIAAQIKTIGREILSAQLNQDVPFEKIVEKLNVEKDLGRHPVVQILFDVHAMGGDIQIRNNRKKPDKNWIEKYQPSQSIFNPAKHDLSMYIDDGEEYLRGELNYATSLYAEKTITTFIATYKHVLRQLSDYVNNPDGLGAMSLGDLDYLNEAQYVDLVNSKNSHASEYLGSGTIKSNFEDIVRSCANFTAIAHGEQSLTYSELNEKANRLANYLLATYKVENEEVIGLCMERSIDSVIVMLGIIKAGAAYLPVDPSYPAERINYITQDASCRIVITQSKFYQELKNKQSVEVLSIDGQLVKDQLAGCADQNPIAKNDANSLAYVIYTSGTTGKPKGVMIEQKSVLRLARNTNYSETLVGDSVAHAANIAFDAATYEVWVPLLNGACCCVVDQETVLDIDKYVAYINTHKITSLFLTTALFNKIKPEQASQLETVKTLYFGGELVSKKHVKRFLDSSPATLSLYHVYGPTESTTFATYYKIDTLDNNARTVPIGKALSNTTLYVLDEEQKLIPPGAIGELYIGGDGLARGYLGKQGLTGNCFIKIAFNYGEDRQREERLYRTGDLVRMNSDGDLEYIGRNDFQVKVRGFRIELEEIEKTILEHSLISQCLVTLHEMNEGGNEGSDSINIVAYFTASTAIENQAISDYLKQRLPKHMLPAYFMQLDEFPLNKSGKINRTELPAPIHQKEVNYSAPQNDVEKGIVRVWSEVLGLSAGEISIHDNFFDLGGNSLSLIVLKSKLLDDLSLDVKEVSTLFKYPTISGLIKHLSNSGTIVLENESAVNESQQSDKRSNIDDNKKEVKSSLKKQRGDINDRCDIAVVGLSGEFSGCPDIDVYWQRLLSGEECVERLERSEGEAYGIPSRYYDDAAYIPVGGRLTNIADFDPGFWGLSAQDALFLDPQVRKYLMHSWWALEQAGCLVDRSKLRTGVFAGIGSSEYFSTRIRNNPLMATKLSEMELVRINTHEFLATRLSYLLGLTGLSMHINTACSTSLVAIVEACKNLAIGTCDVGLAGGVFLPLPENHGYFYQAGMIYSKDGHCRTFDENSSGVVSGAGVGVVVLKRLADAEADGSKILSVIKGYATNNDGHRKVGYTAPSVVGQTECILAAQKLAGVSSDSIDYVECHGTATQLGDPIEVAALHDAFSDNSSDGDYSCRLGAVKANIGHADSAAGVASFIKANCMLQNRMFPPQINYASPNPNLHMERTQFRVETEAQPWEQGDHPRRMGISSFGIGGTNAHVILEEYQGLTTHVKNSADIVPIPRAASKASKYHLLPVSAHSLEAFHKNVH
ncbi:MAG: amino acid adenylation domain-containing protein, partial [Thioalkalispiraceae bacterium]